MARIVVVGSLNVDLTLRVSRLPLRGQTVTANSLKVAPGGKGANQAVAAARLETCVSMIGRVGKDSYGEMLLSSLREAGVNVSHVAADPELPTGTALITVDTSGSNTIVVYQGANVHCSPEDVDASHDVIAGSQALVTQLEIPLETVERALQVAKAQSIVTVLNPAPARDIPRTLLANVDFLIPNEVEASLLSGIQVSGPDSAIEAATKLRRRGSRRVIVTLGEHGAVFCGPEGTFHVPAFKVRAVDTTAAGDAFIAAFTTAWVKGDGADASLRQACAAGALATTRTGAQPSLPSLEEVYTMLGRDWR